MKKTKEMEVIELLTSRYSKEVEALDIKRNGDIDFKKGLILKGRLEALTHFCQEMKK